MRRESKQLPVKVGTAVETSTSLSMAGAAGAVVFVSGLTSSVTLTVHGLEGGAFSPLFDSSGAGASVVVPAGGSVVSLPDAVFGTTTVRLTSDADIGTATSVVVSVKS